jgi:hypothetical protein
LSDGDLGQHGSAAPSGAAAARRALARVQDQARGGGCRFEAELDCDAQVGVGGKHDAGVAELVGDRLEFLVRQQHQRGGTVPEVVQPDRRQAGLLDEVVELVGQVGRGQRLAVLMSEDPALGRGGSLAEVAFLQAAMGAQDDDRLRVQGDRAAAGFRLQRARLQLAVGPLLELP